MISRHSVPQIKSEQDADQVVSGQHAPWPKHMVRVVVAIRGRSTSRENEPPLRPFKTIRKEGVAGGTRV